MDSTTGNIHLLDVCSACPPGTYSPSYGSLQCDVCSYGTYSSKPGQAACTPCPVSGMTTTVKGASDPASQCICERGTYTTSLFSSSSTSTTSGSGSLLVCIPCGICDHNQLVVSECSNATQTQCQTCDYTALVGGLTQYSYGMRVDPASMCKGIAQRASVNPQYVPCTSRCSAAMYDEEQFAILLPCMSGTGSYDTSICVSQAEYKVNAHVIWDGALLLKCNHA
jgi:hypothetical protein